MPSTIKLRIIEARDLPVMDRKSGLTDAYVSLSFGEHTDKTSICRKTLHPKWDHLFRIDVPDDTILQDEPIRLTVLDKDVYSSDNTIGVVILDLNCLLVAASELKGWYPIFDTLRGVRGYLCVQVKLQFFGDVNPFKSTAAGVLFFCASRLSESEYEIVHINGFCEELIMAADPEYHWTDSFRTSRTSNEARMLLLHQLASTIRRSVGSKALEMGANAVVAYRLQFDFEGEGGIIARGLGTACTIERRGLHHVQHMYYQQSESDDRRDSMSSSSPSRSPSHPVDRLSVGKSGLLPLPSSISSLPFSGTAHVDVDLLSLLNIQRTILKGVILLTITYLPPSFDLRIGGVVSARSVKILAHKNTDKDLRDKWWQELRNEIRSHARALNCHAVLGYSETSSIVEGDICVLSAVGTAVQCDLKPHTATKHRSRSVRRRRTPSKINVLPDVLKRKASCSVCHITYSRETAPFRMNLMPCAICGKHLVPDMLLATIVPGKRFEMTGGCHLVEARVVRSKKKCQGEPNATLISETIPFIEFDLHRQLMYKLRLLGMNSAFRLQVRLTVGDNLIVAVANATATFLPALPLPPVLRIARSTMTEKSMVDAQDLLVSVSEQNIAKHSELLRTRQSSNSPESSTSSDESDEANVLDDDQNRQAVVLQIDDEYDEDVVSSLLDPCPPDEMYFMNTDGMGSYHFITADLGSLTAFRRISCHLPNSQLNQQLSMACHDLQAQLAFSVRHSRPLALTCIQAQINIPDEDEIDIIMTAQVVRSKPNMHESDGYNQRWPRLFKFSDKPVESSHEPFDSQVSISALEVCPEEMTIVKCLGRVHLHFINERWLSHDEGGLSRYAHQFLAEAHSVLRANVAARGGNCLLSYSVNQFSIAQPRRDQVYSVITVSGDAVVVHREKPGS